MEMRISWSFGEADMFAARLSEGECAEQPRSVDLVLEGNWNEHKLLVRFRTLHYISGRMTVMRDVCGQMCNFDC